jgi:hypothetical protein
MLSARSPKYVALYDPVSGVHFNLGWATVTEEQALLLAERMFVDGIEIGEFDEDGRPINLMPAKKWRDARRGESGGDGSGPGEQKDQTEATAVARPKSRSK